MATITVKAARVNAGKTQQEVADAMGVHVQTYGRIEKNPEDMSIKEAKKFADIVGVNWLDLSYVCNSN